MKKVIKASIFFNLRKSSMTYLFNKDKELKNVNIDYYVEIINENKNM